MKNIEIKTRWLIIFGIIFFALILTTKMFILYYANHLVSIEIWHQRLKGGDIFYLQGLKIPTPENCAFQSSRTTESYASADPAEIWFHCATSPTNFDIVVLKKLMPNTDGLQRLKKLSEKFIETDEYFYIILEKNFGQKTKTALYYIKYQNIEISSHSEVLAEEFANLLIKQNGKVGLKEHSDAQHSNESAR